MVYIGFMWPFLLVARRSNARLVFLQMLILPICQHVYMPGSAKHQVYFPDRVEGEDGESTVSPIFSVFRNHPHEHPPTCWLFLAGLPKQVKKFSQDALFLSLYILYIYLIVL